MDVKLVHPRKASEPILVTEFGIIIDVKPEQSKKALSPILEILYSTSFITMEDGISILPEYEAFSFSL